MSKQTNKGIPYSKKGLHLHWTHTKTKGKGWYWNLMASNGRKVATSGETFRSKQAAVRSIKSMIHLLGEFVDFDLGHATIHDHSANEVKYLTF